jgi:large subunit ribosomal protein LP2
MRHVAAYLMLVLGGKASPTEDDIKGVLSAVGAEADDANLALLLKEMEGKDINGVIAAGKAKLATVAVGGGGGGGGGGSSGAAAAVEEKKEEEKEKEESEDMGGGMGLFGDEDGGGGGGGGGY